MTNIMPGIKIENKALWLPHKRILAIADLHLGYEEMLNENGVLIPRAQFKEIEEDIQKILKKLKPKIAVINGDLKHQFGRINQQEWDEVLKIINIFKENCEKVILIKGNHDTVLKIISKTKNLEVKGAYCIDSVCFLHGDVLNKKIKDILKNKKIKTIIIGHEHTAISIRDGLKAETYKCFLKGKWDSKKIIVMPSFSIITEGHDILKEKPLSPFLQKNPDLDDFEVYIVSDKVYEFGKLKNFRKKV